MKHQTRLKVFLPNFLIAVTILLHSTIWTGAQEVEDEHEFDYIKGSEKGPSHWGDLKKEWAACKNGAMQSPIDLSSHRVRVVPKLGELKKSYKPHNATVKNRGHDIQRLINADNELAAVEYIEDIYTFYKEVENESRHQDYMNKQQQPDLTKRMRETLLDWLMDVHSKFHLALETLYLTINIINRFLSVKVVPKMQLQLVGISAMLMGSKYEEIWPLRFDAFDYLLQL